MPSALHIQPDTMLLCEQDAFLYVFRASDVDDIRRISTKVAASSARVRISSSAGPIGINRWTTIFRRRIDAYGILSMPR